MTAPAQELPVRVQPVGLIGRAGTFIARVLSDARAGNDKQLSDLYVSAIAHFHRSDRYSLSSTFPSL